MKKNLLLLLTLSTLSVTSCSKSVNFQKESTVIIKNDEGKTEEKTSEVPTLKDEEKEESISLNEIKKGNETYYYGDLKKAGFNHLYNDIYQKGGQRYQIIKRRNYTGSFKVSSIKYTDEYIDNQKFFVNSSGEFVTDIDSSDKNYRPKIENLEYEDEDKKESYLKSEDKIYNFEIYNIGQDKDKLFQKEEVEGYNFINNYKSYQILDKVNLNYNGYTYRIAKFVDNNNKTEYKYIRYKNSDNITSTYKTGYKYETNDILLDNGAIKFVPVEIEAGIFANNKNDINYSGYLDSQICNHCDGVLASRVSNETIFITRNEYDSLYARSANHNPYSISDNDWGYFTNSIRTYKVTPYNQFGSYCYKYQPVDGSRPSSLNIPLNGKENMSNNEVINVYGKVKKLTATYSSYPVFFSNNIRKGYSTSLKTSITKNIELKKMRTHHVYSPNSFQLQKISEGEFDSYSVVQQFNNFSGLFIDKNIEVSSISKTSIDDLYSLKNVLSKYEYSSKEEIRDYSLVNSSNLDSVVLRSEVDSKNNVSTYDKVIKCIKREEKENVDDDFIIKDELGYYSFKYKNYFNLNQKYNLDYYFDGLNIINKKELRVDNFITELYKLEENKDNEYLYQIIKSY